MRHKGVSIVVASQDPPSVPLALIELSDVMILHRFNLPGWLKHLQKASTALADLTSTKLNALAAGEAYIWASRASDDAFTRGAIKTTLRPRLIRDCPINGSGAEEVVGSACPVRVTRSSL